MPKRFSDYWYNAEPLIHKAALFNLRDNDVAPGGKIAKGAITSGQCGYAVAEAEVPGYKTRTVEYLPNRCVLWHGFFLTCMALPGLPVGPVSIGQSGGLRHRHYVVAEFTAPAAIAQARQLGLPLILTDDGRKVANVEVFHVPGKTPKCCKAKLL